MSIMSRPRHPYTMFPTTCRPAVTNPLPVAVKQRTACAGMLCSQRTAPNASLPIVEGAYQVQEVRLEWGRVAAPPRLLV